MLDLTIKCALCQFMWGRAGYFIGPGGRPGHFLLQTGVVLTIFRSEQGFSCPSMTQLPPPENFYQPYSTYHSQLVLRSTPVPQSIDFVSFVGPNCAAAEGPPSIDPPFTQTHKPHQFPNVHVLLLSDTKTSFVYQAGGGSPISC